MGFFDAVKSAVSAVGQAAMTPIDVVADVVTGGGDMVNGGDTYTEKRIKKAAGKAKDAYDETFEG
jgi:hypothetical protein